MLGIRFIKVQPTDYVLQYRRGQLKRQGAGLSFFYFGPTSSLVRIPTGSVDVPFIFEEVTADFQSVTVQGQLTYRIAEPQVLAGLMNFTLGTNGRDYVSEDPQKLDQRLINHVKVLTTSSLKALSLRQALASSDDLVSTLRAGLGESEAIRALGIEILGLSILAIRPTPETARALEAEAREQILREADEAVYARRNAAVEQERAIKENELSTEVAVENKKRQIEEARMDAKMAVQQKNRELQEAGMEANIALEEQKKTLVELATENARQEADTKAYGVSAMMKALSETDVKVLQALAASKMEPGQLIAQAFRDLAADSSKIGQLNVSPDLLRELLDGPTDR